MTDLLSFQTPQSPIYEALPASARIWIYQSDRTFSGDELPQIKSALERFATSWVSHNRSLRAFADVLYNRFLLLMVDESQAGASGCSIDASVRFLHQLGQQLQADFFDRMTFAWLDGEEVRTAHQADFSKMYEEGEINDGTLVFDNLVPTKGDFEKGWLKPLGKSWHKRMVG